MTASPCKAYPARGLGEIFGLTDAERLGRHRCRLLDQPGDSFGANYRTERGWPRDAFFAKGTLGQYVIIIPSERLVIVRLGRSPNGPPEADGVFELVRDVVAATGKKAHASAGN